MKYHIIQASSIDTLIRMVNTYLDKGYKLQGGVSCMVDYYRKETYLQSLVLE